MEKRTNQLFKAVIVLGIIAVAALVFRLWAIFFIAFELFIGARIWMRILKAKMPKPNDVESCPAKGGTLTSRQDICEQVSMWVNAEFPNAKWVWAQSDTLKHVALGEEVFILLNSAGGYRRAKVCITENAVSGIEYIKAPAKAATGQTPVSENVDTDPPEGPGENYELMAYEWVEAHINELNECLNEAIGRGETEYLLEAKELPITECWESVCGELKRAGVSDAVCVQDGIKIKIN